MYALYSMLGSPLIIFIFYVIICCYSILVKNIAIWVGLVSNSVFNRVFDVAKVLADCLVVALFWKITNSKWSVFWRTHLILAFEWELAIRAISLPACVEAAVLEYGSCIRLSFVKDESSSSLVVQFSHIFFAFPGILSVN